jgi:hypothetical protein
MTDLFVFLECVFAASVAVVLIKWWIGEAPL